MVEFIPAEFEVLDPRFAGTGGDRSVAKLFSGGRWLEGPAYHPAGRFVLFSSQYQPSALQGLDASQVAKALGNLSSPPAQGILGAANWLTASLCEVTGGKPAAACTPKAIKKLRRTYYSNP